MAISLKIKGNKRTNEGIGNDLVSIGDNRFQVIDAQYPGSKGATDFIVIRHLHDKSIYTIVCKNVTPCDSNREGTLYISVSVPAKEHVDGLFNMLIELQNAYKSMCMTYDGAMYHFMARNDIAQPFEEIIARYRTVRYPYKRIATGKDLTATAYLFMTPEQISDLLNDPMRGEFSRYGEVVLVPVGDPSQYVSTINIPAKIWRSYKIYVNGRQTGQTLSDPTKTVTITLPETSSHEAVSTTFSISQARETRMPGIAVDDEAQIIYLNMQPKPKPIAPVHTGNGLGDNGHNDGRRNSGGNKRMFAVIAAGVIVVLGILAYVFFFSGDEKKEDNNNNNNNNIENNDSQDKNGKNDVDGTDKANLDSIVAGKDQIDDPEEIEVLEGFDETEDDATKNQKDDQAKKQKEAEQKNKNTYNDYVAKINKAERLKFSQIDQIYKERTNFDKQEGYTEFKNKVEFVKEVVDYIKGLNSKTNSNEYKTKIQELATRAGELGLNGLKSKLMQRIPASPNKIKESIKKNTAF
ncbi:MAG: hypothetical protein K2G06_03885 [Muribaculaceae bacterium]|nr:hypothetical protein [Muribaculaceae bacterium]